jgi:hypothetical protein
MPKPVESAIQKMERLKAAFRALEKKAEKLNAKAERIRALKSRVQRKKS